MSTDAERGYRLGGILPALAVGLALMLGGGGSPAPMPELALQLLLAGLFATWLWSLSEMERRSVPRDAWLLMLLASILPALQLIPLPPALWQALPGRELEVQALSLIGAESSWQSWSQAPTRTLASLLAILSAVTLVPMTAVATPRAQRTLVLVVLVVALLSIVLGAAQLSTSRGGVARFYEPLSTYLDGFQANHNSAADLLLIGMIAAAALIRSRIDRVGLPDNRRLVLIVAAGTTLVLSLGLVLTASRAGIALLPLALLVQALLLVPLYRLRSTLKKGVALAWGAGLALMFGFGGIALWRNKVLEGVVARYNFNGELRPELWRDSIHAIGQNFPFGSGMGNFVSSLVTAERLEVVRETMPNRAHNDFLELAVEGGIFGILLLCAALAVLVRTEIRSIREPFRSDWAPKIFAFASLMLLGLHSLVDYPFRSMSLACVAAVCAGLILAPPHLNRTGQTGDLEEQA